MTCWARWSDYLLRPSQAVIFDIGEYGKQWENNKDASRYTSKDKARLPYASRFFGRPYSHRQGGIVSPQMTQGQACHCRHHPRIKPPILRTEDSALLHNSLSTSSEPPTLRRTEIS